mmetsp:Transcript_81529/g.218131  ORF Transcript_81529/g.218131 Transcript_81529/m.218131 type:complete len:367 (+) Transcript_81529:246-1346(+)
MVFLCLLKFPFLFGFRVSFVGDCVVLLRHTVVCVLDVKLVGRLCVLFGLHSLGLFGLCIPNDLLNHTHYTAGSFALLVGLEPRGGRRSRRVLLGKTGSLVLLVVEPLQHVQSLLQQFHCGALVGHSVLEIFVLLLAVLPSSLQLGLQGRDFSLQGVKLLRQGVNRVCQCVNLGFFLRLVTVLEVIFAFVRVDLFHAVVLVLDLILLVLQQLSDHVVDCLLHLSESIQADFGRQSDELRRVKLVTHTRKHLGDIRSLLSALRGIHLHKVESPGEEIVGVVACQETERFGNCTDFLLSRLLPFLIFLVTLLTLLLEVHQEFLIGRKRVARVLQVLLRVGKVLISRCQLLLVALQVTLPFLDLILLGGL